MMHLNRYARKRLSKRKDRKRVANSRQAFRGRLQIDDPREQYKGFDLSGPRKYSKQQTNRAIRQRCRAGDIEEDSLPNGGDYRKYFDYWWNIY